MMPRQQTKGVWLWSIATIFLMAYWLVWADPNEQRILSHTLALSLSAAAGAVLLGSVWAYAMWGRSRWQQALRWWVIAATLMPPFLHLSIWDAAIGKLGWITADTDRLFQPLVPRWLAAWWVHTTAVAPAVGWLLINELQQPPPITEQQALTEHSARRVFWKLTVVRLRPVLWVGGLWALLVAAREIAVTDLYQIGTMAEQIYLGFSLAQPDRALGGQQPQFWQSSWWFQAITLSWIACSGTALIRLSMRLESRAQDRQPAPHVEWQRPTAWQWIVGGLLSAIFIAVPMINLMLRGSLVVTAVDGQPQVQYQLSALSTALARVVTEYWDSLSWSAQIGLWGGVSSFVLGICFAWYARRNAGVRAAFWLLTGLTLAMPGPLIGLTYFQIFDCDWGPAINRILDRTILLPVLATMTYGWPIVAILSWHLVHKVPSELLDAAEMDGVPRWRQLGTLLVRGSWRQLVGIAILLFAWMFGELSASQMVLPAGVDTVPRLMLGFLHAGVDELTAAFGLILVAGWFLMAGLGQLFIRLNSPRRLT